MGGVERRERWTRVERSGVVKRLFHHPQHLFLSILSSLLVLVSNYLLLLLPPPFLLLWMLFFLYIIAKKNFATFREV